MEWLLINLTLVMVFGMIALLVLVFYIAIPAFFIYLICLIVKALSNGK